MSELINNFEIFDVISNDIKKVIKRFYVFDNEKGNNVLFVTINDKVFGFGSNKWGVCGFGHQMVVKEPKIIEELCDKSVIQFYNGYTFALALTSDNKLYGWGDNEFGQLGLNVVNPSKVYKPVLIEDFNGINIEQISCGSAHTLVLTSDGMVYGWGDNEYGEIGCGKELGEKISITRLTSLPIIKSIYCSYDQSFALTDNGMVYSWGYNRWCNLGHELKLNECVFKPKLIINLTQITSICSSSVNAYFLSNESEIYFCGKYYDENNEQCFQLLPKVIEFPKDLKLLVTNKLFERSIHSISNFKALKEIGILVINNNVYQLNYNRIDKTNFKSMQAFYAKSYQLTYGTIDINNELIEEKFVETITKRYKSNEDFEEEEEKRNRDANNDKVKGEVSDNNLFLSELDVQKLLSQFECPVCMNHITPPILQCLNGHIICRECHRKLSPKTCPTCRKLMPTEDNHNLALEQMAVNMGLKFPCKFQTIGCQMTVLFSDKASHENCCKYEPYLCPGLSGPCNWSGNEEQLIQHLTDTHKWITLIGNRFLRTLQLETINIKESYKTSSILKYDNHHFIWCNAKKYSKFDEIFTFFMVFIGQQSDAMKYKYKCEIVNKSNGSRLTFEGIPNSIRDKSWFKDSECLVFTSNTAKRYFDNGILTITSDLMNA